MKSYFTPALFQFLYDLSQNNSKEWFHANKARYEEEVKGPILDFLEALSGKLGAEYEVSKKSILRQHRDTRFSKDKSPYKTTTACFMYHKGMQKSDHPHGYYLHLAVDECFFGAGVHTPPKHNLEKIRNRIVSHANEWKKVAKLPLTGESLKRPPQGFDPEHQWISDIKRKDYIHCFPMDRDDVVSDDFLDQYLKHCKTSKPLMDFLTKAVCS